MATKLAPFAKVQTRDKIHTWPFYLEGYIEVLYKGFPRTSRDSGAIVWTDISGLVGVQVLSLLDLEDCISVHIVSL